MRRFIPLFALFTAVAMQFVSCTEPAEYRYCEGATWGTTYHITYKSSKNLDDSIITVMRDVEMSLSPFSDSSIISRINRGEDVKIDSLINRVFLASQEVNAMSEGTFDPTVAPIVNLWGFGYKNGTGDPTQEQIDSALALVGIRECSIKEGKIVKKHERTEFNFSAITKGYGCDLIGEMLSRNGCDDYMVEIGGEMALKGKNSRGEDWHVQIDAPVAEIDTVVHEQMTVVALTDCGVATSGNYRNFRETKSGRKGHIISPLTGQPITTTTLSATVIAENCMMADALATACMAMPIDDARKMIESRPGTSAMFIIANPELNETADQPKTAHGKPSGATGASPKALKDSASGATGASPKASTGASPKAHAGQKERTKTLSDSLLIVTTSRFPHQL